MTMSALTDKEFKLYKKQQKKLKKKENKKLLKMLGKKLKGKLGRKLEKQYHKRYETRKLEEELAQTKEKLEKTKKQLKKAKKWLKIEEEGHDRTLQHLKSSFSLNSANIVTFTKAMDMYAEKLEQKSRPVVKVNCDGCVCVKIVVDSDLEEENRVDENGENKEVEKDEEIARLRRENRKLNDKTDELDECIDGQNQIIANYIYDKKIMEAEIISLRTARNRNTNQSGYNINLHDSRMINRNIIPVTNNNTESKNEEETQLPPCSDNLKFSQSSTVKDGKIEDSNLAKEKANLREFRRQLDADWGL